MTQYNTAELRLSDSIMTNADPLDTIPPQLSSLSLSDSLIDDNLKGFIRALRKWFSDWFDIPVRYYVFISQPIYGQLIYAITMLSRFVKLSSTKSPNSHAGTPKESRASNNTLISSELLKQIDLDIDVLGIIDTLIARFEGAKKEVVAAQGGEWENSVLDLAARKLKFARSRFERWSEMVSIVGGEGVLTRRYMAPDDVENEGDKEAAEEIDGPERPQLDEQIDWTGGIFNGMDIDHEFLFDGPWDWGVGILDSI